MPCHQDVHLPRDLGLIVGGEEEEEEEDGEKDVETNILSQPHVHRPP